jgi:membrane-bound lytic murein transglycosylase D
MDIELNDAVKKHLARFQTKMGRELLNAAMRRAAPVLDYIADRIAYYGLPAELLYLPIIESEFNPFCYSRSGAAGIWQFMMNSIGGYNIVVDEWRDDRRDFMKSTDAALRKLKYNYQHFGDWALALAAYNCGAPGLDKAIKKAGTRDYWELCDLKAIKSETREYVPRFYAAALCVQSITQYGIAPRWGSSPMDGWAQVKLEGSVDITLLSELSGVPLSVLRSANPELRYNVTPPPNPNYFLKVPSRFEAAIRAALEDKSVSLIRFYIYVIKKGDTLSALSRHYGVSVAMILKYNPSLRPQALKLGAKVLIPALKDVGAYKGAESTKEEAPAKGAAKAQAQSDAKASAAANPSPAPAAPSPASTQATAAPGAARDYLVKKGDTLWSIARRYGLDPDDLAKANGMDDDDILKEGMTLKLPIK